MKHSLILLLAIALSINLMAQEKGAEKVKWYSFEEAIKLTEKEPKKIFIDVYTDWCSWCKKMEANTFTNPKIAKLLNENFYPVRFDAESVAPIKFKDYTFVNDGSMGKTHQLAAALLKGKMSYPSIAYLDETARLIDAVPGYMTPEHIEPILEYIGKGIYKNQSFQDFRESFKSNL